MTEPTTPNIGLIVPNTGDLVGSWGTSAVNVNWQVVDGKHGGVVAFGLSSATTIALTAAAGSTTPSAGPNQQSNFMLQFNGVLSGTAIFQFSVPGMYVADNRCSGSFPVVLQPASGTGTQIGVPPGKKTPFTFDGTDVDFANPPDPGTAIDLHGFTNIPGWMLACTKQYALIKDGQTYSSSLYPTLARILGTTFGGVSGLSFGVPDERNRMRISVDTNGPGSFSNRVTAAGSGINGQSMGAAGGDQLLQSHNHTLTDPQHSHGTNLARTNLLQTAGGGPQTNVPVGASLGNTDAASTGIAIAPAGSGGSQNMPPTIISFLALIKT
jgi:microcystin-dependent protein